MITAVDSSVLLDILTAEPPDACVDDGTLVVSDVALAQTVAAFSTADASMAAGGSSRVPIAVRAT